MALVFVKEVDGNHLIGISRICVRTSESVLMATVYLVHEGHCGSRDCRMSFASIDVFIS
jgi:hypothetical protein